MHHVTAIIVTYNSAEVIGAALSALRPESSIGEIIVVDNASADNTCAAVLRNYPGVTLIRNDKNLGFGAANNVALERVGTEFALLINPDAVLQQKALDILLAAAARYPDAGILAPQLFYEDGSPQASYKADFFTRERFRSKPLPPEGDLCAGFLSGAVWLVRMEALRKTGFFDPALFFYYEDDDLCLRMRSAGYAPMLVENAHAVHLMGKSSAPSRESRAFRLYHNTWSRLYMEYKYRSPDAARRMAARRRWKYQGLLWIGQGKRYRPRLRATNDFISFLATQPR